MPKRKQNKDYRSREYLTEDEIQMVVEAAGRVGRHRHRDATIVLIAFRHGLRVAEVVSLRWDQIDFNLGLIHVNRVKRGTASIHPLHGPELDALKKLKSLYPQQPYVFCSERHESLTTDAIRKIITRAGHEAGLPFSIHPHMFRHACGFKLAQAGEDTRAIQDYLGHRNIQHTVRYTHLTPERFRTFWND